MSLRSLFHAVLIALLVAAAGCAPQPPARERRVAAGHAVHAPAAPPARPLDRVQRPLAQAKTASMATYPIPAPPPPPVWASPDRDRYWHHGDQPLHRVAEDPVSTFGMDVDTGAYTHVRRMLREGRLPPADAVRTEEFLNYFDYGYRAPADRHTPFSITTEVAPAPWNRRRQLLLIGIQGYRPPAHTLPPVNLVFLVDVSGSMASRDKLPLLQASLRQLVPSLRARDRLAIVTYAGSAGIALSSTPGDRHARILAAIDGLHAGGSTNGAAGIELAYAQAREGFIRGGINRVLLATDGDFNVGTTGVDTLVERVALHRRSGIALSTLGFGDGNFNEAMAMRLADAGDGDYRYIDTLAEAQRVLVDERSAALLTIARDARIQVEFNPAKVGEYRLLGYVKRQLRREDFNNDRVDSGDVGAGASVTVLYEITPADSPARRIDPLRYAGAPAPGAADAGHADEIAYVRIRYKPTGGTRSRLLQRAVTAADVRPHAGRRLRFAAAVAAFAGILRASPQLDGFDLTRVAALARGARGPDPDGRRAEFITLVRLAQSLHRPDAALAPAGG